MILNSLSSLKVYLTLALFGLLIPIPSAGQLPFSKGVNLTGWFQAPNARQIQFSRFSKKDFENIKSLGGDVVRLPINLHAMTSGEPDYILDTLFLKFLEVFRHVKFEASVVALGSRGSISRGLLFTQTLHFLSN